MKFREYLNQFIQNIREDARSVNKKKFPLAALELDGKRHWFTTDGNFWTEGFWIGLLIEAFIKSEEKKLLDLAEENYEVIKKRCNDVSTHDLGFLFFTTALKLKVYFNQNQNEVIKDAVVNIMKRYVKKYDLITAYKHQVTKEDVYIVDSIMNLFLPFKYYNEFELEKKKKIIDLAKSILKLHVNENGKVIHGFVEKKNDLVPKRIQGYRKTSCWSRGFAWALYGSAWFWNRTKDDFFKNTFVKLTNYLNIKWKNLNYVPFDFEMDKKIYIFDSSSAIILCCGLNEGVNLDSKADELESQIFSWIENYCLDNKFHLIHGCYHYPNKQFIDNELIFGDYYFFEYLKRKIYKEV